MSEIVFKEIRPPECRANRQIWIHPIGDQAVFLAAHGQDSAHLNAIEESWQWIKDHQLEHTQFQARDIATALDRLFAFRRAKGTLVIITKRGSTFYVESLGDYRLYGFGATANVQCVKHSGISTPILGDGRADGIGCQTVSVAEDQVYVLCDQNLNRDKLLQSSIRFDTFASGQFVETLKPFATNPEWTAIAFPATLHIDYVRTSWKYNPFVGPQDERKHERRGLRDVADALFISKHLEGFLITTCPPIVTSNASRLFDGLLVSPIGVFPLELKDNSGDVEIHLGKDRRKSMIVRHDGKVQELASPIEKMRDGLRRFGDLHALKEMRTEAKRVGLVIFTGKSVKVQCVGDDGTKHLLPYYDGDVIICTPATLVAAIELKARSHCGKTMRPVMSVHALRALVDSLLNVKDGPVFTQPSPHFQVDPQRIESESTDYCSVHPATHCGDRVWAKRFFLSRLSGESREQEMARIGREAEVLQRLGRRRTAGVPYYYDTVLSHDSLYVFVEPGFQQTLQEWMTKNPPRHTRLRVMGDLLRIVQGIAALSNPAVVHRNINPGNVRIGHDLSVQLINFELAQVNDLSTLMPGARRNFSEQFLAPEVNQAGRQLTVAVDVYSLMLCFYFTLMGSIPPNWRMEMATRARRPGYWEEFVSRMNLPSHSATLWQRALHDDGSKRPSLNELVTAMNDWT